MAQESGTAVLNLIIPRGADYSRVIQFTDKTTGVALDFTGYTAEATIKEFASDTVSTSFTASVLVPETGGQIQIDLTDTQVNALDFEGKSYLWTLFTINGIGTRTARLNGKAELEQTIFP